MTNQKGFAPILIIVTILAVFVGGYLLRQQQTKPAPTPSQPTPQLSPSPEASPVQTGTGETANWRTYKSPNGYSVKYPSDTNFSTNVSNDASEFEIKNNVLNVTFWKPVKLLSGQTVDTFLSPPGLGPAPNMQKIQGSMLDGTIIYRYEGTTDGQPFINIGIPLKGDAILQIRAYHSDVSDRNLDSLRYSLDQILSTFRFD